MKIIIYSQDDATKELPLMCGGISLVFSDSQVKVLEILDQKVEVNIVIIDFDNDKKGAEKFNKKIYTSYQEQPPIRIVLSSELSIKELKKHQKGRTAADGYIKKPLTISILEGVLKDLQTADYLEENEIYDEGDKLDGVDMGLTGQHVIGASEMKVDPRVRHLLNQHNSAEANPVFENEINKQIQSRFDYVFGVAENSNTSSFETQDQEPESEEHESFAPESGGVGESQIHLELSSTMDISEKLDLGDDSLEEDEIEEINLDEDDALNDAGEEDEIDLIDDTDHESSDINISVGEDAMAAKENEDDDLIIEDEGFSLTLGDDEEESETEDSDDILFGEESAEINIENNQDDLEDDSLDLSGDGDDDTLDLSDAPNEEIEEIQEIEEGEVEADDDLLIFGGEDENESEEESENESEEESSKDWAEDTLKDLKVLGDDADDGFDFLDEEPSNSASTEESEGELNFNNAEEEDGIQAKKESEDGLSYVEESDDIDESFFEVEDSVAGHELDDQHEHTRPTTVMTETKEGKLSFSEGAAEIEMDEEGEEGEEDEATHIIDGPIEDHEIEEEATKLFSTPFPNGNSQTSEALKQNDDIEEYDDDEATRQISLGQVIGDDQSNTDNEDSTVLMQVPQLNDEVEEYEEGPAIGIDDIADEAPRQSQNRATSRTQTPQDNSDYASVGHYNENEYLRLQATIRQLREEREAILNDLKEAETEKKLLVRDNLGIKAELDEAKIEVKILKKRFGNEIDEMKYRLRLSDEKKLIVEEKSKSIEKEFDRLNQKVRLNLNQIKQREKDLESRLELVQMDTETQIKTRDQKILELKRKIDQLEFNMENASIREQKTIDDKKKTEERMNKIMKTLRGSIEILEDDISFNLNEELED
jgi:hypothetical protein